MENEANKWFATKSEDGKETKWSTVCNAGTIKRLKDEIGFDANAEFSILHFQNEGHNPFKKFLDQGHVIDLLCCICQKQIGKAGMEIEDFLELLGGNVIEEAMTAAMEGLFDFFSLIGIGATLREAYAETKEEATVAMTEMKDQIKTMDRTEEIKSHTKKLFSERQPS